jgi:hypothetical protein
MAKLFFASRPAGPAGDNQGGSQEYGTIETTISLGVLTPTGSLAERFAS